MLPALFFYILIILKMKILTKGIIEKFRKNIKIPELERKPVIKLFTPDASATWLLSEYDETDQIFFGLCDLGLGFPELGYVCLTDLQEARGRLGLPIERDLSFEPKKNLLEYAHDATKEGRIIS